MTALAAHLIFLKLGGSLITDKSRPHTARPATLARLAAEIAAARAQLPQMRLLLGHGSGSFGHVPAKRHGTRQGVQTPEGWRGFAEVWREARALNNLVMDALTDAGLAAIAFPPSAAAITHHGGVVAWDLSPLRAALEAGLMPVVFGDVVFDTGRGGTILSTEDVFVYLAQQLCPKRILLAGIEPGVWADYPACTRCLREITPASLATLTATLAGSANTDVTGGMASKVAQMLALAGALPGLQVSIFSGETPGALEDALARGSAGTVIHS